MPHVVCPQCGIGVEVALTDLHGVCACSRCGTSFYPMSGEIVEAEVTPPPSRYVSRKVEEVEAAPTPLASGRVALLIALGVVAAGVAIFAATGLGSLAFAGSEYEALIREHVQKHIDDPEGLEFIEWGKPKVESNYYTGYEPATMVKCRLRAKNKLGARVVNVYLFYVRNGVVIKAVEDDYMSRATRQP